MTDARKLYDHICHGQELFNEIDALVTAAGTLSDLILDEAHNAEIARGTSTPGQRLDEAGLDAVICTVADKLGEMRTWFCQLDELGPSVKEALHG